jgi:hypothetical protein
MRRRRAAAVAFCTFLVLLTAAERRVAETHLNRLSSAPALENNDLLDGDELRVRLVVAVEDVREPDLTGTLLSPWAQTSTAVAVALPAAPPRWSSARAPPSSPAAR